MIGTDDEVINYAVGGGTPGTDSNDYVLWSSVTAYGAYQLSSTGVKRISFHGFHSHAGTLKAYMSTNGGTNWDLYDSTAVAAPVAGDITGPVDYDVAPFKDWKLVWTNGGTAQSPWRVGVTGYTRRSPAT